MDTEKYETAARIAAAKWAKAAHWMAVLARTDPEAPDFDKATQEASQAGGEAEVASKNAIRLGYEFFSA
jgi:hypothetical protein